MNTLHFSIGEDLGIRLAEIAREHIHAYDVEGARSIWKDAFGCPDNLLDRLTTGKLVVTVDDPVKCLVNVCKREELDPERQAEYPEITRDEIVRLIEKNFRDYVDEENNENWDHFCLEISNVTRMITDNEKFEIPGQLYGKFLQNLPGVTANIELTIPARYAAKTVLDTEPGEFESELEKLVGDCAAGYSGNRFVREGDVHKFYKIVTVLRHCLDIIKKKEALVRMLDFLDANFPDDSDAPYDTSADGHMLRNTNRHIRYNFENQWMPTINDFIAGAMACTVEPDKAALPDTNEQTRMFGSKNSTGDLLTQYLDSQKDIDKALDNFGPINIEDGYDAGWIAPDGKCFGLNGTSGNFLHIQLADELMEYYHFKKPEKLKDFANDYYLAADKGFVKFHHKWITYEGYDCVRTDKPVPLTKKQIEAICRYGNACYNGELEFGYDKKRMTMDEFKNCSDYVYEKLFSI